MPTARPAFKFAMVTVNYFTKLAEAKPLAVISSKKVQEFIWEFIICRFGIPQEIVSDNRMQFDSNEFRDFWETVGKRSWNFLSFINWRQSHSKTLFHKRTISLSVNTPLSDLASQMIT